MSGSTGTQIDVSSDIAIANPVVLNLQVIGSTLTAKAGSTTIFTDTDSTITTGGDPGIMVGNGSGSNKPLLTTWSGGTASAQPTVANPTSSLATGSYAMPQTGVTLSDSTSSASICGTTNGDTPTASVSGTCDSDSGNEFTYSSPLTISATTTLKLLGTKTGDINSSVVTYTYTQSQVANPTATHGNGTYNTDPVSETLSDATGGSTILYCIDTANSCTPGTTYSGAFNVSPGSSAGVEYVRAQGTESGYLSSSVVSFIYTFTVSAVSASPGAGTYTSAQSVTLSIATTTGAVIHYRTDGTAAACSDAAYSTAISVSVSETVTAIGCKTNYNNSAAFSAAYVIQVVASPTASPVAGGYFTSQTVTLSDSTGGSTILYCQDTINSCTPASTYSTALTQSATGYIRAQGTKSSWGSSAVVSFAYAINPPDQTGSYAFSDTFTNYYQIVAANGKQLPIDQWNSSGLWTANITLASISNTATYAALRGGGLAVLYNGTPQTAHPNWLTYSGATGFNGSGIGQYSSGLVESASPDWAASTSYASGAYIFPSLNNVGGYWFESSAGCTSGTSEPNPWNQTFGGTSSDGSCIWTNVGSSAPTLLDAPCVFTFSSAGLNGYSFCLTSSGLATLGKSTGGTFASIATSSAGACISNVPLSIELRTLGGVNMPLCGGSTPAGMSATYTDGSPLVSGNPGAAGSGLYHWTGGTINAGTPPSPISWGGNSYTNYGPFAWNTGGDGSSGTWPFYDASGTFSELQTHTPNAPNTLITVSGATATVKSTLNPGSGVSVWSPPRAATRYSTHSPRE